ncbi:Phd Finger Protein 12 [Manis pentadactyla]|nr:Phd Finger Protein 12 [Manis pentadactyla]
MDGAQGPMPPRIIRKKGSSLIERKGYQSGDEETVHNCDLVYTNNSKNHTAADENRRSFLIDSFLIITITTKIAYSKHFEIRIR